MRLRYCQLHLHRKNKFNFLCPVKVLSLPRKIPLIYVDRKRFSHATWSGGCRYLCNYTQSLEGLGSGDVAVFSENFNVALAEQLRRKDVLIAFESGESPVHMPRLSRDELEQVCMISSILRSSELCRYLYSKPEFGSGKRNVVST